ncbi:unnamed protein product [Dovyalis caffra]|uniref:Uncharacterized protein n=1 Tax=Dovyalis caffra TaxID=77055 RepID=A0AAV1SAI8_9ROSI|nr:unnamed protein product [Dovyalis caffra]
MEKRCPKKEGKNNDVKLSKDDDVMAEIIKFSSSLLNNKHPIANPKTTAKNTLALNDMTANINKYPIPEFIPKSTAPPTLTVDHLPFPPPPIFRSGGFSIAAEA